LAVSDASAFATPLGEVAIDRQAVRGALAFPQVSVFEPAHQNEHSLEVQLPFLQTVLPHFELVPFAVGDATADEVADVLEMFWGGPETLIVISSDLSHYYDYATARRMDRATSLAIERLQPEGLSYESACGRVPVAGLLRAAARHGLTATTIDLRNSGDTAGSREEVVGYGAYAFA
jgi:AmmeMemoRadiSam system protein B